MIKYMFVSIINVNNEQCRYSPMRVKLSKMNLNKKTEQAQICTNLSCTHLQEILYTAAIKRIICSFHVIPSFYDWHLVLWLMGTNFEEY